VDGTDEGRLLRRVAERTSDLPDEDRQVRFVDERVRPETLVERSFRHGARTLLHKRGEEVESLRREVNPLAAAAQFPRASIEHEWPERDPAGEPCRNHRFFLPSAQDSGGISLP
jgi:hypothetical protein